MPMSRTWVVVATFASPVVSSAAPLEPWIAPGIRASGVHADAAKEDGHYRPPDDLALVGESLEFCVLLDPSVAFSAALEYSLVFDTSPTRSDGSLAFVGVDVPARARLLGLGGRRGRFYAIVGLGYAAQWDRTRQFGPTTSDGAALRSSGTLYEIGLSYRLRLSELVGLEIAFLPRVQFTSASNGVGYFSNARFTQLTAPLNVSFPLTL